MKEKSIYWTEQCNYCKHAHKLKDCSRNQVFMQKLQSMYGDYIGTVDFRCDYFMLNESLINQQEGTENEIN